MASKLVQKAFLKGSREFEIVDDTIFVRITSSLKEEKLTIDLSSLDPEPVIIGSELAFYNPHRGRPIFSLLLNKPNTEAFNAFVDKLKQCISDETGVESVSAKTAQSALARNMYEEPPEFAEPGESPEVISFPPVNAERLNGDITMLKTYLDENDIKPLIDSLETLEADPQNEAAYQKMLDAFNNLGIKQGAVLTYASYLKVLVSQSIGSQII